MNVLRTICLSALCSWLAYSTMAQSTFRLQNFIPAVGIDAPVYDADGIRLAGTQYAVELWGGATSDSLSPALDFRSNQRVVLSFLSDSGAGYFTSDNEMAVWQVSAGSAAWLQVRAWDVRLGTTYEEVMSLGLGGYGESAQLYLFGGNPLAVPPTVPSPLIGLQSSSLRAVVPEPSIWALLALGGFGFAWGSRHGRRLTTGKPPV